MGINLTIKEWLEVAPLIFTIIGGIFFLLQWRKDIKTKRAEFIYQILDKFRFDGNLLETTYILDYEQRWYVKGFHESDLEGLIDKYFCYIDYVCYLKSTKNISDKEFRIFEYEVHRVCNSLSAQAYLWNLYNFSLKNKAKCSYQNIINYGMKKRLLPNDFLTNQNLYPGQKYLNW